MSTPDTKPESIVVSAVSRLRESRDPSLHRLKRGTCLMDAMLEPVFSQALQRLAATGHHVPHDNLACALLLQPLMSGSSILPLGKALANSSTRFSNLRFSQLIAAQTPDELFTHLQRALRLLDGKANPFDVARIALEWTEHGADRVRKRLIANFYALPDTGLQAA